MFPIYPVPHTAPLSLRKPPSAGHPVTAALLWTTIQDSVLPCDRVNTLRYVVWWLCCFTLKWN